MKKVNSEEMVELLHHQSLSLRVYTFSMGMMSYMLSNVFSTLLSSGLGHYIRENLYLPYKHRTSLPSFVWQMFSTYSLTVVWFMTFGWIKLSFDTVRNIFSNLFKSISWVMGFSLRTISKIFSFFSPKNLVNNLNVFNWSIWSNLNVLNWFILSNLSKWPIWNNWKGRLERLTIFSLTLISMVFNAYNTFIIKPIWSVFKFWFNWTMVKPFQMIFLPILSLLIPTERGKSSLSELSHQLLHSNLDSIKQRVNELDKKVHEKDAELQVKGNEIKSLRDENHQLMRSLNRQKEIVNELNEKKEILQNEFREYERHHSKLMEKSESKHKLKLEELEKEIEKLEKANLSQLHVLSTQQVGIKVLEDERERLSKELDITKKKLSDEIKQLQEQVNKLEGTHATIEKPWKEKVHHLENEIQREVSEKDDLNSQIDDLKKTLKKREKELENEYQTLNNEFNEVKIENEKLKSANLSQLHILSTQQLGIKSLEEDKHKLLKELDDTTSKLNTEIEHWKRQVDDTKKERQELADVVERNQRDLLNASNQIESLREDVNRYKNDLEEKEKILKEQESQINELRNDKEKIENEWTRKYNELDKDVKKDRSTGQNLESKVDDLQKTLHKREKELSKEVENVKSELETTKKLNEKLENASLSQQHILNLQKEHIKNLEEDRVNLLHQVKDLKKVVLPGTASEGSFATGTNNPFETKTNTVDPTTVTKDVKGNPVEDDDPPVEATELTRSQELDTWISKHSTITYIDLKHITGSKEIPKQQWNDLLDFLRRDKIINTVDLSNSGLDTEIAKSLFNTLAHNETIQRLNLSKNPKVNPSEVINELRYFIEQNNHCHELDIHDWHFGPIEFHNIIKSLNENNHVLYELKMPHEKANEVDQEFLLTTLQRNKFE
ncbi:hypothetical protein ABK040_014953 [Willaertia magna]